jgi:dTDP-4-dehydrorhamnose reductase
MQKEKIIILGSKGNLGSVLVKIFKSNYEIIAWDREDIDALDFSLLESRIKKEKPDIIINSIAYNAVDLCEEDKNEYEMALKLNKDLVAKLADISIELDSIFIQFVSDYVFDGDKQEGYIETDKTRAISKYGESKILGEKEILNRANKKLKYYLIRTSKLFGPKGNGKNSKESFFDLILRLSKEKKEFNMVHNEEISCFTYTFDLAEALKKIIEEKKEYGIYHIINEGRASWYDGAKYLFELKKIKDVKLIPSTTKDYPRPAKRPKFSVLLNTKLPKLRTWKEALKEYMGKK